MNREKKNNFPWETLDTTAFMMPEELLTYHLFRLFSEKKDKREKGVKENLSLLSSYLQRESSKKEEIERCFQK